MATADYTKRAVKNYQSKFDLVQARFPKGTKSRILATGNNCNQFIIKCVLDALDLAEQKEPTEAKKTAQISTENEKVENLPKEEEKPKKDTPEDWQRLEELRQNLIKADQTKKAEKEQEKEQKEKEEKEKRRAAALQIAESMRTGEQPAGDEEKEQERRAQISEQRFFNGEGAN